MKRQLALISTLILFAVVFVIQGYGNISSKGEIESLKAEIDTLKLSLDSQKLTIERLQFGDRDNLKNISEHRIKLFELESRINRFYSATFDSGEKGLKRIDSQNGFFLVGVEAVKPFANGVKLTLRIGNPLAARFGDFKVIAKWGKSTPGLGDGDNTEKEPKDLEESKKVLAEREFSFPETLLDGTWNYIELQLPNTNIDELGHLELSMETKTVLLKTKAKN